MDGISLDNLKSDKNLLYDFVEFFFGFKLYSYQIDFLHKCLIHNRINAKWCRQSGKSQTVAIFVLIKSIFEDVCIVLVSPTQNQSDELLDKIKLLINNNNDIKLLVKSETAREINIKKSRIISLPTGFEGRTIRGYAANVVVIEEAGIVDDDVVNQVLIPMIASKGDEGVIIKVGTPLTHNHFYRSFFEDPNYISVNVTWREAVGAGQYTQKFIDEQKAELTSIQFATEYEAEFISSNSMMFSPQLLKECSMDYNLIRVL